MNRKFLNLLSVLVLFSLNSAHAVEFHSARSLSLGGAGRATPLLTDAIYLNPSYASFAPVYSLSGSYESINPAGRNYNVSVQDSRTEIFQGGVGFTKREGDAVINIGASRRAITQLGFGLGSKFVINDRTRAMTSDFIFSTTYIALQWMYATLIVDNVLGNFDRTLYIGMKFIPTKNVNIYLDPFYTPEYSGGKKAGYHLGLEFGLMADFFFRLGKYQDAEIPYLGTRGNGFGIGAGWLGPRLSLDYSLSRALQTNRNDAMVTVNSFSTTVFF